MSLPWIKSQVVSPPAWAFYLLTIGGFSLAWGATRFFGGLSFLEALVVLVAPFGLLIWLRRG
jgi:hypothetical protein